MTKSWLYAVICAASLSASAGVAWGADPAPDGQKLFQTRCGSCHSPKPAVRMTGPSLAGVVGRKAGSVDGFPYSPALRNSGIVWTDEQLDVWLTKPMKHVPGAHMSFAGLPDAAQRAAIIAYLKTL
jgi:cytochrome c